MEQKKLNYVNHLNPSNIARPYNECLIKKTKDVFNGLSVFKAKMPWPVKGININNGANVVIAPKVRPEKYDIFNPSIMKTK